MKYTCAHALVALCAVKGMEGERKLDWSHQDVVDPSRLLPEHIILCPSSLDHCVSCVSLAGIAHRVCIGARERFY